MGYILVPIIIFVIAIVLTLLIWRYIRSSAADDIGAVERETEELRLRAEENVKSAEEMVARAKRLEDLMLLQRRGRG